MKTRFVFWQKWMTYVNVLFVIVGAIVAFGNESILFKSYNLYTEKHVLGGLELTPEAKYLKQWLFGVIGGTIVGFHILIVFISEFAFVKKEKWAYSAILFGVLFWFLTDSVISIRFGALHNFLFVNVFALIMIALPLIFTAKDFKQSDKRR
ncbi:MAG: hypothetical protein HYZ14_07445 [Bacteroidetes bacterium]|nr:hypothetical protein [Bacteroidota bacterium]